MYVTHITQYSGIDLKKYKTKVESGIREREIRGIPISGSNLTVRKHKIQIL